uniref:Uncharacterized protein n=1 Tax=Arundo donax TaxID=35708 RepID=A0A0A9EYK2_ARUDO
MDPQTYCFFQLSMARSSPTPHSQTEHPTASCIQSSQMHRNSQMMQTPAQAPAGAPLDPAPKT